MALESALDNEWMRKWVREWAFVPMPFFPSEQDWDLVISGEGVAEELFDVIESRSTPKDLSFLNMLYITIGDMARCNRKIDPKSSVFSLVERTAVQNVRNHGLTPV